MRVESERGIALVMAIGIMAVLGIVGVTVASYSTSATTESNQTQARTSAFALAEGGINNIMSLVARIHNPRGRECGCPPECWCQRTSVGRVLRWYSPKQWHSPVSPESKRRHASR